MPPRTDKTLPPAPKYDDEAIQDSNALDNEISFSFVPNLIS